jgi:O-antigen/teichoic acid export membrane protein
MTKKLFLNASWLFGGKTVAGVFAALETIIVARMLGVHDYGLLALIVAYVDILNNFFDFRVWETATKYIGTFWTMRERDKTLSMIKLSYIIDISSGFLALVITIITANLASRYLIHSPQAYSFICIYAFSLLINTANSTSEAILRIFDRFKNIAFISSFYNFVKLAAVSIALYFGFGIKGVLFSYLATSLLGFSIRLLAVSITLKENQLQGWSNANLGLIKDKWKEIAWFLGNTSIAGTLKMANDNYLGILVLGYFAGKDAVAYYKVAKSFVKVMIRIADPLYEAIYPELVRISNLNALEDFKNLITNSAKNLMKFMIPVAVVIFIFSDLIINLTFGKGYLPASNALRIITVAVLISYIVFWISPALLAFGKPGLRNILGIISTITYIVLLFLLVPAFSYIGAAFAFLGQAIVSFLISIIALKTSMKERKRILEKCAAQTVNRGT